MITDGRSPQGIVGSVSAVPEPLQTPLDRRVGRPLPNDTEYMLLALALARETAGLASPNPQVGCVLTRNEEIIGRGGHLYDARDHAEIVALKQAAAQGHSPQGATAYVTLEPCSHHGRTGPCADALIAAGVRRVVIATVDPNPQVAGRGIARLRAAGVEVTLGICQAEARTLNDAFAFSITRGRPFVTLKAALSTDGMLAPAPHLRAAAATGGKPEPHWLTGPLARAEVQQLRHASDAILTGIGTVLADNPALTDRTGLPRRRPLQRIVLDTHLRLPLDSELVRAAAEDLLILCSPDAPASAREPFANRDIPVLEADLNDLPAILALLGRLRVNSLLLEAGSTLNAAFLREDLVDRVILYYAPTELGPGSIPFARGGPTPFALEQRFLRVHKQSIGPDVRVSGLLHDPWSSVPQTS